MFGYRVPAADEAMLISGGRYGRSGAPFRVVTGHGAVIVPFFRKTRFLTLAMCEAEVAETCVTRQGISLNVRSVIAFNVGNAADTNINALPLHHALPNHIARAPGARRAAPIDAS